MKLTQYISLLLLTGAAASVVSCTEMDDYLRFTEGVSSTYTGKLDSAVFLAGNGRLLFHGELSSDPKVSRIGLYWNVGTKQDSLSIEVDYAKDKIVEQEIALGEGSYNFQIYTYDSAGNHSIPMTRSGNSYGANYLEGLYNRVVKSCALDGEDIASRSTYRPVQVYAADINSDGVIELPRAVLMAGYKDAEAHDALYMLDWYAYGLGTTPVQVSTTYQCISDAWSLRIDRSWHDRITAVKSTDGGLSMVSFYEYRGAGQSSIPLFNIYCVTGSSREYYAGRTDLIQLGQTSQAVYFAKIPEGAQSGTLKIGAEEISSRFSIVKQAWNN